MLGIVPKLYEDELFYSWLCRYYVAKGFTSNSHFIEEVTGNNRLYLNKEFVPPFKAEFRHDIEKIFGFENVIRNHTLYGQEARFYTEEEINNVWELFQTDSFDIRTLFRMQKSKEGNSLSYCPLCVKEERESIGECYWHKSHQIQGMHLVRLYLMCIDILTKEEIITYRADEHDLLMSIRNGEFQKPEGGYRPEFFELVDDLEKKMKDAAENTSLPDCPDTEAAYEMLVEMNKNHILKMEDYYDGSTY